jgi:hypothetical protein
VASGTRAKAIDFSSVGEKPPLVVSPSPAAVKIFICERSTPLSSRIRPSRRWLAGLACSAARPTKLRASSLMSTVHDRPAFSGETSSSMSWP